MNDVVLALGPVEFAQFEIPARIDFGGVQRLAVHDLPGGTRVVDALGPVPSDVAWAGTFSGPDAGARAELLDGLRMAGATLSLSWDVFLFSVVIRSFVAEYTGTAWVPYRLICTVLQDRTAAADRAPTAFLSDVLQDVASAASFCDNGGVDLSAVQSRLGQTGAGSAGTVAYAAANRQLAGSLAETVTERDAAGELLAGYANNLAANDVATMIAQAGQTATLAVGAAYLSRAVLNFAQSET